jgi:outer membrane receptor for ferrienterochelin and colicin
VRLRETEDSLFTDLKTRNRGYQAEGQYLYRMDLLNVTAGFGFSDVDRDSDDFLTFAGLPVVDESTEPNITQARGYVYGNLRFPDPVLWTIGVSYDDYTQSENDPDVSQVNPKFGVQWNVTDDLRLRAAAFRTLKPAIVNNRTLEPTQIAGFNQFFDDLNATKSWRYGVGLDWRLTKSLFAGAELTWRDLDEPVLLEDSTQFEKRDEQLYRGYLYWTPLSQIALSAELIYDRYHADQGVATDLENSDPLPRKVETLSVPLSARYFHPSGPFAGVGATYVDQKVRNASFDSDDFVVVDALVGYRFPKRFGIASFQVNNLFNTDFHYQDNSFREFNNQPTISRYVPERTIMGRITINF